MSTQGSSSSPRPLPSGTITFLFTDIEGSTGLVQRLGEDYDQILQRHNEIIRAAIEAENGDEIGTEGDSFFVVFSDAGAAVRAAVEAQRALATEPWPYDPVRVRMGLHTGEGRLGGDSYIGVDVNRAARISAAGHGSQVVISEVTAGLVRDRLPDGVTLRSAGRYRLKGIDRPETLYQLEIEGLETRHRALRAQPEHPLPTATTPLVGREADVQATLSLLRRTDTRLVTITGPGGTGKTRLVTELLPLVADDFPDGLHYVDLSALVDWRLVLPAVGRSLGVLDAEGRDMAMAAAGVVGESRKLVVLDNMEQVLEAAADLTVLIANTVNLKVLVTSREPLQVRGEQEYPLNPLPVPAEATTAAALQGVASVDLFLQRARAVIPSFELTEGNAEAVSGVVRHLDGLPLAIELAAPKLRILSPEMLLERLEGRIDLLKGGGRDMPQRHQALDTTISWSYDLLDDDTKRLFRRLGVFAGGFTMEAAEAICSGSGIPREGFLDAVGDLVSKSLVTFYLDDADRPRYRLLETLRAFARDQLAAVGEEADARSAHLRWCVDYVARCEQLFTSARFPEMLDLLETERHNIRAALSWSESDASRLEDGLRIAGLLWIFWDVRGYAAEGMAWLQRLLATPGAQGRTQGRALALGAAGWLGRLTPGAGDLDATYSEATDIWAELGERRMQAWSLGMHGMITYNSYQPDRAREQFEEAARIAREVGDEPLAEIWCNFGLAHVVWMTGAMDEAEQLLIRSIEAARRWSHVWAIAHGQFSHGMLAFLQGDLGASAGRLNESLRLRADMRDSRGIADCLGAIAILAGGRQDFTTATVLLGAADAQREAAGQIPVPWLQPFFDQIREASLGVLGETEFDAHLNSGRALSRDEAVALAEEATSTAAQAAV